MRIAIPVFHETGERQKLVLERFGGNTLLGATLDALRASGDHSIYVGSDSHDVLLEAFRHGAQAVLLQNQEVSEKLLLPGTLALLDHLGPFQESTAVLNPALPTVDRDFLECLENISFNDSFDIAITVTESKNHPCQCNEAVQIISSAVFFPLKRRQNILVSTPFPFNWPSIDRDKGRMFQWSICDQGTEMIPAESDSESWPAMGVFEHLSSTRARLVLPLKKNSYGAFREHAATTEVALSRRVGLLQELSSKRSLLSLDHNLAVNAELTAKIWQLSNTGLKPIAPSGISLQFPRAERTIDTKKGKLDVFPIPEIQTEDPIVLWIVRGSDRGGPSNVLIPWESTVGGWQCDADGRPLNLLTNRRIQGRQDFPLVYEFDEVAAVFGPGIQPKRESSLNLQKITSIPEASEHIVPVKSKLDILAQFGEKGASQLKSDEKNKTIEVPENIINREPQHSMSDWRNIHIYADTLGSVINECTSLEKAKIIRSIKQVCQKAMDRQTDKETNNTSKLGYRAVVKEVLNHKNKFKLDGNVFPMFAIPGHNGNISLSTTGPGTIIRFESTGEVIYNTNLNLSKHNTLHLLSHSHLTGGLAVYLNRYDKILLIDAYGHVVDQVKAPMPYITSAYYDMLNNAYHLCSGYMGVCRIYNEKWTFVRQYESTPDVFGYKQSMRAFYDQARNVMWVILGALEHELPLTLAAYSLEGDWLDETIEVMASGIGPTCCVDSNGVFHFTCKRADSISLDGKGNVLGGSVIPSCLSLQVRNDEIWAVTRYEQDLRQFQVIKKKQNVYENRSINHAGRFPDNQMQNYCMAYDKPVI